MLDGAQQAQPVMAARPTMLSGRSPEPSAAASLPAPPILFLHIPKTAGTSFLLILQNLFSEKRMVRLTMDEPGIDQRVEALVRTGLHKYACINGHLPYAIFAPYMQHFRGFTILRNPIARVLSLYRFLRRRNDPSAFNIAADTSLETFLDDRTPDVFLQTNNGMCRMLCNDERLIYGEAHDFSTLGNASWVLESALETLHRFDFGLAEQMAQTCQLVRTLWDLPFTPDEVVVNTTNEADCPITANQLLRIVEMNTLDIALYQHAAALFRERMRSCTSCAADPYGIVFQPELNVPTPLSDVPGRQGFHEYEKEGLAWLSDRVQARLRFRAPTDSVRIVLQLYALTADFPAEAITLRLNGNKLRHEVLLRDQEWITLQSAPVSLEASINVLAIEPPYFLPVRYIDRKSNDYRYLSLALATITFLP
jgi:hypothetical protein